MRSLVASLPNKCTGCELCVFEAQRQLSKVGLEGSFIRIFREPEKNTGFLKFSIDLDPQVEKLDLEKIKSVCPNGVFDIIEEEMENGLTR